MATTDKVLVFFPDEEKVALFGRAYPIEFSRTRHSLPRVVVELNTMEEMLRFPWDRVPENDSKLFFQGDEFGIHVRVPDQNNFCCYSLADLRRNGQEYCWRFKEPTGCDGATIKEFRQFRKAAREDVAEKLRRYGAPVYLLDLRWNHEKSSWQGSRSDADYRVIYTVNERWPHEGGRIPGKYVCYLDKARVVEHPPRDGKKGFRLNVIQAPRLRVLADLKEFQAIVNNQTGALL